MTDTDTAQPTPLAKVMRQGGLFFYALAATILGTFAVIWMVKPGPLASSKGAAAPDRRLRRYRSRGPSHSYGMAGTRRRAIDMRRAGGLTPHEEVQLLEQ